MSTQPETESGSLQPKAQASGWIGPLALFVYGSTVAFWLWAKWLFAPQMFFLPPLPPVEVLVSLVQNTLGPWLMALFTFSALGVIALDALRTRSAPNPAWWRKSLLRGSIETVVIHVAVWVAGTLLFFGIMAVLPGSKVHGLSLSDPVVRGLLLFTTFLSLLMSGPITALLIAARCLGRRKRDSFPPTFLATLNHAVAVLIVPLAVLWILSGYPGDTLRSFSAPPPEIESEQLLVASRDGDTARVKSLISHGTDVNHQQDNSGTTALIAASANGHTEIVQKLLAKGANANLKDSSGRTALMAAASNRQGEIVTALLAAKADVQARDAEGKSAIVLAVMADDEEITQALLKAGADSNATLPSGDTILISACRRGDAQMVRTLLDAGADPALTNKQDETAIQIARRMNHQELVALLESKAKH